MFGGLETFFDLFVIFRPKVDVPLIETSFVHNALTRQIDPRHPEGPWSDFLFRSRFLQFAFFQILGPGPGPMVTGPGPRSRARAPGRGLGRISRILGIPHVPQEPWAHGPLGLGSWALGLLDARNAEKKNANHKIDLRGRKTSTDLPDGADRSDSSRHYERTKFHKGGPLLLL